MCPFDARSERRRARRLPIGRQARIKSLVTGDVFYGECLDLSVDGLSIRSAFVPQFGERLEIVLRPPSIGDQPVIPLIVEAEVRRCLHAPMAGLYDIGLAIVKRKS